MELALASKKSFTDFFYLPQSFDYLSMKFVWVLYTSIVYIFFYTLHHRKINLTPKIFQKNLIPINSLDFMQRLFRSCMLTLKYSKYGLNYNFF